MGKDEHVKAKNSRLAQTPKNQLTDGKYVEFSEELADNEDKKALARRKQAEERRKS